MTKIEKAVRTAVNVFATSSYRIAIVTDHVELANQILDEYPCAYKDPRIQIVPVFGATLGHRYDRIYMAVSRTELTLDRYRRWEWYQTSVLTRLTVGGRIVWVRGQ